MNASLETKRLAVALLVGIVLFGGGRWVIGHFDGTHEKIERDRIKAIKDQEQARQDDETYAKAMAKQRAWERSRIEEARLTLKHFYAIQEGCDRFDIDRLTNFGARGELRSESGSMAVYVWSNPDGSQLVATFRGGRLVGKSQFGLH